MSPAQAFQASSHTTNVTMVTGGFMKVPNSFVRSSLSPTSKMVALWLGGHSTSYRFTKVSMAKALGISRTRLDQCLAELVAAGVLQMDLIKESLPKRPQYLYRVDLGVDLAEAVSTLATQTADDVSSVATQPPASVSTLATQNDVSVSTGTTPKKTSSLEDHLEDQGAEPVKKVTIRLVDDEKERPRFGKAAGQPARLREPRPVPESTPARSTSELVADCLRLGSMIILDNLVREHGVDRDEGHQLLDSMVVSGRLAKHPEKAWWASSKSRYATEWQRITRHAAKPPAPVSEPRPKVVFPAPEDDPVLV